MKVITAAELVEILRKHKLWLADNPSGARADLTGANLTGANLYGADLTRADLTGADLTGADLTRAHLTRADLTGADLYGADLTGADLYGADLTRANLTGANYLNHAANVNYPIACPEKGSFIGFKKVQGDFIVELEIPADALRSSACSRKCRCSHAKVVSITNDDGTPAHVEVVYSKHDSSFRYKVGDIVKVNNFDTNRWNECAPDIHFFITRQEAVNY